MKRILYCSMFLAAVGLFFGCAPQGENPEKMIAAAKELDKQFSEALNKGDVDAVMATYWNSPELVSFPTDAMEVRGWQAAKDGLQQTVANMPNATFELTETNYKAVGDVVIGWGKWRLTMTPSGGEPVVIDGRYTDVKAERDGKWVYILDHGSVPLPPPPAPSEAK